MNFTAPLADPSSCKTCETDVGVFLHVDDGLRLGPNLESTAVD